MTVLTAKRTKTHFSNPFIEEYLSGSKLKDFMHVDVSLAGVREMIEQRASFSKAQRILLKEVLIKQYLNSEIELSGKLKANIDSLTSENTFTITTGQQIHLGMGPLYVLYKILNTLSLSEEIAAEYPNYNIVPVFWMATEDHDFEEIKSIDIFNKKLEWKTEQAGAVGRMSTKGIHAVFNQLESEFNLNAQHSEFIEVAKKAYGIDNYANASRALIHHYFGDSGLVIIDADNEELKKSFVLPMENEMRGKHFDSLTNCTQRFEEKGFEPQIFIRDINLFQLRPNDRIKIEKQADGYYAGETKLCNSEDLDGYLESNAYEISPNVVLRPLYQEWILPNLLYVGGPSEIKYWMQLGDMFKHYDMKLPVLYLRTSWVLLPEKKYNELEINDILDLYLDEEKLIEKHAKTIAKLKDEVLTELIDSQAHIKKFGKRIEEIFPSFNLWGKINKLYPKLLELQNLSEQKFAELALNDPAFNKLQKFRKAYASKAEPQERTKHIVEFSEWIPELQKNGHYSNFDNLLKINHLLTKSV